MSWRESGADVHMLGEFVCRSVAQKLRGGAAEVLLLAPRADSFLYGPPFRRVASAIIFGSSIRAWGRGVLRRTALLGLQCLEAADLATDPRVPWLSHRRMPSEPVPVILFFGQRRCC